MNSIYLAIFLLTSINAQAAYNSHLVSQELTNHKTALTNYTNKVNKATEIGNTIHDAIEQNKTEHTNRLAALQTQLQAAKSETDQTEFAKLIATYNESVRKYNVDKKNFCPHFLPLDAGIPVNPTDPKFVCQHVSNLCARYLGHTLILLKIFNKPVFDAASPTDDIKTNSYCLIDHIKTHIIPTPAEGTTEPTRLHDKTQLSFQAKCCENAVNNTLNANYVTIKNDTNPSALNGETSLSYLPAHIETTDQAKAEIAKTIQQIKAALTITANRATAVAAPTTDTTAPATDTTAPSS